MKEAEILVINADGVGVISDSAKPTRRQALSFYRELYGRARPRAGWKCRIFVTESGSKEFWLYSDGKLRVWERPLTPSHR